MSEMILVESVTRSQDLSPAVRLRWGDQQCDLTPTEARVHAFVILEAAEAAMTDGFFAQFLRDRAHLDDTQIALVLADLRTARGDWRDRADGQSEEPPK